MAPALLLLFAFALLEGLGQGQDFDLLDALDEPKKPTSPPKKPPPSGDFNTDLEDATGGKGGGQGPQGEEEPEADGSAPQGLVPGLIGAAVAAVTGAGWSFIAYQRRRLCFRERAPPTQVSTTHPWNTQNSVM
ncbi:CD99 antigen-like isoform X2 [Microtus oregoni]|uniref:CD99 antigen-like isoform X2 n=1 Tax=Microtus oregoni TaxID=111838 RepID=UPI001BB2377B|nr:CD99 antigen-like isoform X2 [Microtus oregoni]XP_041501483.1 CD99 antigen-like isoform X2 [Microtus oregoni]XP_041501484.1 CD99 antigen-like isoform X2 [Microtus oregoni]